MNPDDRPLSIVPRPGDPSTPVPAPEYWEAEITSIVRGPVESFLTPWGLGAIAIFLLANSLLTWSQTLSPTAPVEPEVAPRATGPKTPALRLDTLTNVAGPAPSPVPTRSAIAPSVAPAPIGSLTSALLPPPLQPALMPAHILPAARVQHSLPTPSVPKTPTVAIVPGDNSLTVARNPPPSPSPALLNERMVEELRRRSEDAATTPFFQREKTRRLERETRRDTSGSAPAPTGEPSPSAPPGSIIIEGGDRSENQ